MSDFAAQWKKAKTDFGKHEKPAEKGHALWLVPYRKGTGVDSSLKSLDKLFPSNLAETAADKVIAAIGVEVKSLETLSKAYISVLDQAIQKEKPSKETSDTYRDMKILRTTLDAILQKAKLDYAKMTQAKDATAAGVAAEVRQMFISLGVVSPGLRAACAKALQECQEMLKNPTVKGFNDWAGAGSSGARGITQNLAQLVKWAIPAEANILQLNSREKYLDDPHVKEQIHDLYTKVGLIRKEVVIKHANPVGDTPFNANVGRMGNNAPTLAPTATRDDVIRAVKHFSEQVKNVLMDCQSILK